MLKIKKVDSIKKKKNKKYKKTKKQKEKLLPKFISIMFYQLTGFLFCILLLFIMCGGKNFIQLYLELEEFINTPVRNLSLGKDEATALLGQVLYQAIDDNETETEVHENNSLLSS